MKKYLPLLILFLYSSISFSQTDLIISEYVEGWSNNKALELYNPTDAAINLSGYRLTRYSNGEDLPPAISNWFIGLPDYELQPYRTYVVVIDQRNPDGSGQTAPVWEQLQQRANIFLCPDYNISEAMYFNGDDAIAIEKTDGSLIDMFAYWGPPQPALAALPGGNSKRAWTDTEPYFTGLGNAITADHTLIRKSSISTGVTAKPSLFNPLLEYDSLEANTFEYLGWHIFDGAPANATPAFPIYSYEFIVTEQASAGTIVGTPTATDAEEDDLFYYLNSGNFVYINDVRIEPFVMDKLTGQITVSDPDGLIIAERDTFYLQVSVNDGYTQANQATVMVRVSNETVVGITGITIESAGGATTIETAEGTLQFTATIAPSNSTIKSVYWMVENGTGKGTISYDGLLTAIQDGIVTVKAMSKDGSGISDEMIITLSNQTTNIYFPTDKPELKIYPNPVADEYFYISNSGNISTIYIANISGRILKQITNKDKNTEIMVPVSELKPGIYMLKICLADQKEIYRKLVVQ